MESSETNRFQRACRLHEGDAPHGVRHDLYTFQTEVVRHQWERLFRPPLTKMEINDLRRRADKVRAPGASVLKVDSLQELPIFRRQFMRAGVAVAALTVPFVHSTSW